MSEKLPNLLVTSFLVTAFLYSLALIGVVTFVVLGLLGMVWWLVPALRGMKMYWLVVVVLFGTPPVLHRLPGARYLNSSVTCVDIHTGRLRFERYFLYVPVSTRITDTELSKCTSSTNSPAWKAVTIFEGGATRGISPHFVYHGAARQILLVEEAWSASKPSEKQRREDAARLIESWTTNKTDLAADDVVRAIEGRAYGWTAQ